MTLLMSQDNRRESLQQAEGNTHYRKIVVQANNIGGPNTKIAPLIDNETEAEIIDAEDTRTKIRDGIADEKLKLNS